MRFDGTTVELLEQALIGSILLDNASLEEVKELVCAQNFERRLYQYAFEAMTRLHEQGKPLDLIDIAGIIEGQPDCENALSELYELMKNSTGKSAHGYAEKLNAHINRMAFARALERITHQNNGSEDLGKTIELVLQEVNVASRGLPVGKDGATFNDMLTNLVDTIDDAFCGKFPPKLDTGFYDVDRLVEGMRPGNLVIIAGNTSMGKSTFAMNVMFNIMYKQRKSICLFSFEMSEALIATTFVAHAGGVTLNSLKGERVRDMDMQKFTKAVSALHECKIKLYVSGSSVAEVRKTAKSYLRANPDCSAIVIDYLQLMSKKGAENKVEEISFMTRELKLLAVELNIPIILLSQLNRSNQARTDKTPQLSDLRGSGSIEQDADIVMLVHRENKDSDQAKIIIAKNRSGPTGEASLIFDGATATFKTKEYYG